MPSLRYQELAGDADPPIVEQLLSQNALRQRRYRERQKALRDVTSPKALRGANGGEHDADDASKEG